MKVKKRGRFILLLALVIAVGPLYGVQAANTDNSVFYESTSTETITSGVQHEKIIRFTRDGWQNINVLRVDATNPTIKIDAMTNTDSLVLPKTTMGFAEEKGAVAAINASFFNTTNIPGSVMTIGPLVESGKIKSASYNFNRNKNEMATFAVDQLNKALIDYWKVELSLKTQDGKSVPVGRYNMPYYGYNDLTVLDRNWGAYSPGTANSDFVEMVVDKGRIVEIRNYQPSVKIPEDGFVVVTKKAGVHLFNSNFKIGERVTFEVKSNPDLKNIKTAVTGGCTLVENGAIPSKFTHDVPGVHPRTAIGASKDGKEVIMVTVDGRQQGSTGMTLQELADLMIELGAYNALNLDGGGSTTMVARKTGTTEIATVNSPSDGSQRRIPTAIGVTTIAPRSTLSKLFIHTDDSNIFVNTGRTLTVTGVDANYNPTDITGYNILWSVSGVKGVFKGNVFYPSTVGRGKITAKLSNYTAEMDILVLDQPVKIIPPSALNMAKGETIDLPWVTGVDKNGFQAIISPQDINWELNRNLGLAQEGKLTAFNTGAGVVTLSFGSAKAYAPFKIASVRSEVLDEFESTQQFVDNMKPTYAQKTSGQSSGMMYYQFLSNANKKSVTASYRGAGLLLEKNISRISVQAYSNQKSYNRLSAEIIDANGQRHTLNFAKVMDWTGWKRLEISVEGIVKPAHLTGISVYKTNEGAGTGFVYLDDLTQSTLSYPQGAVQLPATEDPGDSAFKPTDSLKPKGNLHFVVLGQADPKDATKPNFSNFIDTVNNLYDFAAFAGNGTIDDLLSVQIPRVTTKSGYSSSYQGNNMVIRLDTGSKSLTGISQQWNWLIEQLEQSKADNVFIFMSDSPGAFKDKQETSLFYEILEKYRLKKFENVWVFSKGASDSVRVKNGVRYMEVKEVPLSDSNSFRYLLVTVDGCEVTYQYKK